MNTKLGLSVKLHILVSYMMSLSGIFGSGAMLVYNGFIEKNKRITFHSIIALSIQVGCVVLVSLFDFFTLHYNLFYLLKSVSFIKYLSPIIIGLVIYLKKDENSPAEPINFTN